MKIKIFKTQTMVELSSDPFIDYRAHIPCIATAGNRADVIMKFMISVHTHNTVKAGTTPNRNQTKRTSGNKWALQSLYL